MDLSSLFYTVLSFVGVILLMIGVLYGIRWALSKTNLNLYSINSSDFRIIDRIPIDSKRQVVRLHDKDYDYVILLGQSDILLNKSPHPNGGAK